jgi:hypothetical protein
MSIPSFEDMVRMKQVLNALLAIHKCTYNALKLHLAIQAQAAGQVANNPPQPAVGHLAIQGQAQGAGLNNAPNQVANNPPQPDVGHLQVHVPSDIEDADDEEEGAGEVQLARVDAQGRRRRRKRGPRKRRQWWVRPWGSGDRRLLFGHFDNLMSELRVEDPYSYFNFLRMSAAMFEELLARVTPRIQKQDTNYRKAHSAGLKLAITLRYMATGENYPCLSYGFRVSRHTIAVIIPEVCKAIQDELAEEVVQFPQDADEWRQVAARFQQKWNLPHALGALDGKHIRIRRPNKSGSVYHNYKGFFSIVLMALVDADYKFLFADCGGVGHQSDMQLFNSSPLKEALDANDLDIPPPDNLPNDNVPFPYFIIGDDAFALREYMMKPFSQRNLTMEQRIYNYRISRARIVVENAFGILAQRWQCFLTTMQQNPEIVRQILHAGICLHNFIRIRLVRDNVQDLAPGVRPDAEDEEHNIIPGAWREHAHLEPIDARHQGLRELEAAKIQRQTLLAYFNSPAGAVPWQEERVLSRIHINIPAQLQAQDGEDGDGEVDNNE